MEFVFLDKAVNEDYLNANKWLKYLYVTKENRINLERVESVDELGKSNLVLKYVERTLQILDGIQNLSEKEREYVSTTLKWSEVAKCGMPEQREKWMAKGLNLQIHNEASAAIFMEDTKGLFEDTDKTVIYTLIYTHGLLGQYIRGEVNFNVHKPLADLIKNELITSDSLKKVLMALNKAVIKGVNADLWEKLKDETDYLTDAIVHCDVSKSMATGERLKRLFPAFCHVDELTSEENSLYETILKDNDLWYAESALEAFSRKEINTVFGIIKDLTSDTKHISFHRLSRTLTYDYEGHRKTNVYKKRIVELCLREYAENIEDKKSDEHVSIDTEIIGDTLYFDVRFTKVCEALINFCVEAERSGIMTYEKNIQNIFDLFGFRRDIFDRLNNEEKYLETMNNAESSTKLNILDYVTGNTIVDVGSGGGVLLDVLEKRYPDNNIIGTDISYNVIETLNKKIEEEGHHYTVLKHNFVEGSLEKPADTIIFSSILHEVYSYTEWEGERFSIDAVRTALKNACASIPKGGRIVIRDGVMAESDKIGRISFRGDDGVQFAKNYMRDFKGLRSLWSEDDKCWKPDRVSLEGSELKAEVNFIREALYTYTWGTESYAQEVMEQFGYFTLNEYIEFLKEIGMKIVYSDSFTEKGYPDHLTDKVSLLDGLTWDELPSTCIIVAEKI